MEQSMASTKMHLAKVNINGLATPDQMTTVWDDEIPGFLLLVMPTGRKTFYLHKRTRDGRQFRFKIGRFGEELSAEQARAESRRICAAVALGQDPAAERRQARQKRKARSPAPTVAELWAAFSEAHKGAWSGKTMAAYGSWFRNHIEPALGRLKAHEVQPVDIRRLYRQITKPATQHQVLRATSSMFSWATGSDDFPLLTVNPCASAVANGSKGPGANKRERYPVGDELQRLVAALMARDDLPGRFFLLCLLSGCRQGELRNAKWADFDIDSATWTKPASSTKQKKLHRLPLNAEAVAILREVRELSPFSPFGKFTESTLRGQWRRICKAAEIDDLHAHDLRHFHASVAASSGESLLVIGGLLGHADQRTTGRYAHLLDQSVRAASAKVGQVVSLAGRRS
jgi:integrase